MPTFNRREQTGRERRTCKRGHPYTDANMYVSPQGKKACRVCWKVAAELRKQAKNPNSDFTEGQQ